LSPLEKDLSIEYLGKKLGINKETLNSELSFKDELVTTTHYKEESEKTNKHIETFKDIFISSLIKNDFELNEKSKELIEVSSEIDKEVNKIKDNQNSNELEKYQNISFLPDQYEEAVVRLYLYFANFKIETLINRFEQQEKKDFSLLQQVEDLKKKKEIYQNTI